MTATREVVTIQAGNFANFIGTHWWNIQESSFCYSPHGSDELNINHDVTFREGLNLRGEVTYTPRLVLIDSQTNLTSIRRECPLYRHPNQDKSNIQWDGPVDVIKEDPVRRNPFLEEFDKISESSKSENTAKCDTPETTTTGIAYDFNSPGTVWSDYLRTNLHPRSLCVLNQSNSPMEVNPFDVYSLGEELYLETGKEMVEDAIRKMCEECDYLQGFHLLFDAHNGFAGITNQILQYLDDEYNRIPSICFPVYQDTKHFPIQDLKEQMHRLFAVLYSTSSMNSFSTFFSPLNLSEDVVKMSQPSRKFPFIQNPSCTRPVPYSPQPLKH